MRFIRQYLFFYLLTLAIPLVMGLSFYGVVYRREYARIESETLEALGGGMERLTQVMADAERLAGQILTNDELMALIRTERLFEPDRIYRAALFIKKNSLIPPNLLNDVFAGYYVADTRRGYVFSKDQASTLEGFFRYDFRSPGMDKDGYLAFLEGIRFNGVYPEAELVPRGSASRCIPYIHRFVDLDGHPYFVLVPMSAEKIAGLFSRIDAFDRSSFTLRQRGNVWIDGGTADRLFVEARMVRGQGKFLTKKTLPGYGLEVELAQPADLISRKISFVPFFTVLGMAFFLTLETAFLVFLAYRSSRPLIDLFERIHGDPPRADRDVIGALSAWFDEIRGQAVQMEDLLEEQRTKLKTGFISGLLNGTIPNPSQVPTLMKHSGIDFPQPLFFTILLQLKEDENALIQEWEHAYPVTMLSLQRRVFDIHGPRVHVLQTALNEICILSNSDESGADALRDRLAAAAADWLSREVQCTYTIGISRAHRGWQEVHRCLKESRSALVYDWPRNENLVNLYHDESNSPDEEAYFPQQQENGILEAIRTGQIGDLQKALEHINRENIERRKLTHYAQTILVSRYQELLLKASQKNKVQDSSLRDAIGQLVEAPHQDVGRFIAETEACLVRLAEAFGKDRSRKEEEDADRISDHLKRNFGDNQLSLLSTSDALGYSVPYINRLVKKYYGKTFRNYMEDLRMDLVRDLIVSTDTPIHQLIRQGGYNSMNTFCKAFKRKYGYNAASLREEANAGEER